MNQNKIALTDNKILSLISERWSPRAFDSKQIEEEKLMSIFEAARWSASAMNEQPWRFVYARKENMEHFSKLFDSLADGNKIWAKNAPVLIACFYKKTYTAEKRENKNAKFDLGLAVQSMILQALSYEIYMHPMAGFDFAKLKSDLNISDDFEPAIILASGYLGEANDLPEDLKARETANRTRKKLYEFVYEGKADFK